MALLLDTHALLWWLNDDPALPLGARAAIAAEETHVSAASAWEITTKHRLGKLPLDGGLASDVAGVAFREGFVLIPMSFAEAEAAGRLPGPHRDPFDRMVIAQALARNLTLVSNERSFDAYGVRRLW